AVPESLLRTAGADSTRGDEPTPAPDTPVVARRHWWDGVFPAAIALALIGPGVEPALTAVFVIAAVVAVVGFILIAPAFARAEERAFQVAAGIDPDAELAPVARGGPVSMAQWLARRRGVQDILVLS